jgi:hypothetical protein
MIIKKLNRLTLNEFIQSEEFRTMPHLPISFHRAVSHINNPRADDDDILLILIYQNELIGYLGILPDYIFCHSVQEKIGWMSCIWTHYNYRGKGIAKLLTQTAVETYNNKIFCTEFTPEAENLYNRLGLFDALVTKHGLRFYRRSCLSKILPQKYPLLIFLFSFLNGIDFIINLIHDRFLYQKQSLSQHYQYEIIEKPDCSCFDFVQKELSNQLTRRSKQEFDWITDYPWIKESNEISPESKRYNFSSESKRFKIIYLKILKNNLLVALLMVSLRDKHMKVQYAFVTTGHEKATTEIINNLMFKYKIDIFTCYHSFLNLNHKNNISCIKKKIIHRKYLQSNGFNIFASENMFQDGDGDCVFV